MTHTTKHKQYILLATALFAALCMPFVGRAQTFNQNVTILPAGVDLLWETDAYTPPFYKGKALYPDGGNMRIVAVPDSRFGNPENLFYTWKIGGEVLGSLSGQGRQVLDRFGTILGGPVRVVVEVRDNADGPVLAASVVQIPTTDTVILLYEHNPLLGTRFEQALPRNFVLDQDEITVGAYPFFFSGSRRGAFTYSWRTNGTPTGNTPQATFRRSESSGIASVALAITNPRTILQNINTSFTVEF